MQARSTCSPLIAAATRPAAARRASISAALQSRSLLAVLEADEAPPDTVDEDRHGHQRDRADQLHHLALPVRQLRHVTGDRRARGQELGPAGEVRGGLEMGEPRVVDVRDSVGPAQPPPAKRHRYGVVAGHVLEHERSGRGGRLAEHAHQVDERVVEDRLLEEVLRGPADRLQDRVTVEQVALGLSPLLAGAGAGEDDRELAGDVDEDRHLVLVPFAGAVAVEPENACHLAVAEHWHVHERGDLALDKEVTDRFEPGCVCDVLDDDRMALFEAQDIVGRPIDLFAELLLPRMCRVADREAVVVAVAALDVADVDVAEQPCEALGRGATISSGGVSSAASERMPTSSSSRVLSCRRAVTSCM